MEGRLSCFPILEGKMLVGPAGQLEILKPSASETILDATGCILPNRHKRRAGEVPGRAASFQVHGIQGPSRCSCGLPGFPQGCPHPRHRCSVANLSKSISSTHGQKPLTPPLFYLPLSPCFLQSTLNCSSCLN